ncbi:hypothetical protein GCM10025868_01010 [Angustibacter aerolatus]|uniref:ANTAR domain-containing protein n=1 Tax=Angustibacter aerolatus TaxID=1162965 RepID=A0ABQ6J9J7_9ACTN|nr:hypothetical protein [Angustibacter aerolatus]GMA84851.1 hypothetical protein GCM10025868_01010 [Angustibacter aerolatus]
MHQATGALSVLAQVPLGDALVLLRAHAWASGVPLLKLSRDVLARRIDFWTAPDVAPDVGGNRRGHERDDSDG